MREASIGERGFDDVGNRDGSLTKVVRVGVAVDPPLLGDLLVSLLTGPHRRLDRTGTRLRDHWEAAIVSPAHAGRISAPYVICLPDDDGDAGVGTVTTATGSYPVAIRDVEAIESLLQADLPA
jgi:hypothetical protein